ncbi:MAG: nucleotidyltransferase domain-containing protein [Clostridiales bacterium]|nr:nucleotidyltransferase domain-containing protein [Clostridiales bacterium]
MGKADLIINYIKETYSPEAIIVYGSFADGSADEESDFDALVITGDIREHDSSVVSGTVLDVWVYPEDVFRGEYDPGEFIQIYDGSVVMDTGGIAGKLISEVNGYIERMPFKTDEEIAQEIDWCGKMLLRAERGDAEGFYRWHWLLADSLEIYSDLRRRHYFGPKKALRYMERGDKEAFRLYSAALGSLNPKYLAEWVSYLKKETEKNHCSE